MTKYKEELIEEKLITQLIKLEKNLKKIEVSHKFQNLIIIYKLKNLSL